MSKNLFDALASAIYVSRQSLNGRAITEDDQKIRASGLYDEWALGDYSVGDIRNAKGQTWECFQAHDNGVYPDINPDSAAWFTFWRPLHGKSVETAREFVAPTGAHDVYKIDEYMVWTDDGTYHCKRDTAYGPDEDPDSWEEAANGS